jgi:hypothetical protein
MGGNNAKGNKRAGVKAAQKTAATTCRRVQWWKK